MLFWLNNNNHGSTSTHTHQHQHQKQQQLKKTYTFFSLVPPPPPPPRPLIYYNFRKKKMKNVLYSNRGIAQASKQANKHTRARHRVIYIQIVYEMLFAISQLTARSLTSQHDNNNIFDTMCFGARERLRRGRRRAMKRVCRVFLCFELSSLIFLSRTTRPKQKKINIQALKTDEYELLSMSTKKRKPKKAKKQKWKAKKAKNVGKKRPKILLWVVRAICVCLLM